MPALFKVTSDHLVPVQRSRLATEEALEKWIAENPELIGLDVLVIGRQVVTDFQGRIDILAIDREGNSVIIELKRDETSRGIVGQILDYASWVAHLTTKQIADIAMTNSVGHWKRPFSINFKRPFRRPLMQAIA